MTASIQPFFAFELLLVAWAGLNWRQARQLYRQSLNQRNAANPTIQPLKLAVKLRLQVTAVCLISALFLAIASVTAMGSQVGTLALYGLLFVAFWLLVWLRIRRATAKKAQPQGANPQSQHLMLSSIRLSATQVSILLQISVLLLLIFFANPALLLFIPVLGVMLFWLAVILGLPMGLILWVAKIHEHLLVLLASR
ncbi:MAG: hypothetical protein AAGG51_19685 [Cyanobacteria bacterium P01_G01_bin.54]